MLEALIALAAGPAADPPLTWNPSAWSTTVTECDRLAAHPSDPDKLTVGVPQPDMVRAGLDRAIAACQAAVAADPKNPRLNYQLARSLGYAGRGGEAQRFRDVASGADYPQALFVVGFVHLTGQGAPRDACKAGALIRRSALAGRNAGLIGFPHYVAQGLFSACPSVRQDKAEMLGFLGKARQHPENQNYFQGLLIESVEGRINALP
jgi:hypothetical protein